VKKPKRWSLFSNPNIGVSWTDSFDFDFIQDDRIRFDL
jgi:hypothetical protein